MPSTLQNETTLLERYESDVDSLIDQLRDADAQASKKIQKQIEQKLQIYWKQIQLVQNGYPDDVEGKIHEASFYTQQALTKLLSAGMMRRISSKSTTPLAYALVTSTIANQQEKANAGQALELLNQALGVYDHPSAHLTKAQIYVVLKQQDSAIKELNYIITNFQSDKAYIAARELKDELETPHKQGPCFIATACYGDFDHPDVRVFRSWRDNTLLKSRSGQSLVYLYYKCSPPIATRLANIPILANLIQRYLLAPLAKRLK